MTLSWGLDGVEHTAGSLGLGQGSGDISGAAGGKDADTGIAADGGEGCAHASVVGEAKGESGGLNAGFLWFEFTNQPSSNEQWLETGTYGAGGDLVGCGHAGGGSCSLGSDECRSFALSSDC